MGYFPNGSAADCFESKYCSRCIHKSNPAGEGCAVMLAHIVHNYDECNNEDSILHMLIPKSAEGFNGQCKMFFKK